MTIYPLTWYSRSLPCLGPSGPRGARLSSIHGQLLSASVGLLYIFTRLVSLCLNTGSLEHCLSSGVQYLYENGERNGKW